MRKPRLPTGSSLLSVLLLLTPTAGLAQLTLDFGGNAKPPEEKNLLDGESLKLDVELPDFPAAREADEKEKQEKLKTKVGLAILPEAIRKDFSAFAGKVWDLRRQSLKPDWEEVVREVKEKGKLDGEAAGQLDALSESAKSESLRIWENKFAEDYAAALLQGDPAEILKSWKPEDFAANAAVSLTLPSHTEVWNAGLKKLLTPEYYATLEAEARTAGEQALKDAEGVLLDAESRAGEAFSKVMDDEVERIFLYVELDESRGKAIRQAAQDALKDTLKDWRQEAGKAIMEMDEVSRRRLLVAGDLGVNLSKSGDKPQENEIWRSALRNLLTEKERQSMEEGLAGIKQRRATALAMTMLAGIDQQVGFSSGQREQLLALGGELFRSLDAAYFEPGNGSFSYLNPGDLLTKLREIPEDQLAPLLDAGQIARWKAVSASDFSGRDIFITRFFPTAESKASDETVDELEASRLIALKLADESAKIKERYFSRMEGRVANLARVIQLPEETTARLRTAGKGGAEQMAQNAIGDMEQNLLRQVSGVKPAELPGRLGKVSLQNFQERVEPADPPLWIAAQKRLLTGPQRVTWKQECETTRKWRLRGLSALVGSEVEKYVALSPEKNALLLEKLEGVIQKYETDISNMLSQGWQYQSYYSTIPVALLTEKESAEVFTPKQMETVRTRCLSNADQLAAVIRQQHDQRP